MNSKKHYPIKLDDIKENTTAINKYIVIGNIPTMSHNDGNVNNPVPIAVDTNSNIA